MWFVGKAMMRTVLSIASFCTLLYLFKGKFSIERMDSTPVPQTPTLITQQIDVIEKSHAAGPSKSPATANSNQCQPSLNRSTASLVKLLQKCSTSIDKPAQFKKYLGTFSTSQKASMVSAFGISNFSPDFNNNFLMCPGRQLLNRPVNLTNEGDVVMPKHFQACKNMSFQRTGKTVALLSFPGSGNSWVRQLIETATGIYTGTYHDCDESYIVSGGMIGEGIFNDNVIAVKIHWAVGSALQWLQQHNIIYIVRNPFDAMLADYNRVQSSHKIHLTSHITSATNFGK